MADFSQIQAYLGEHVQELAQLAPDPRQFVLDYNQLQRTWSKPKDDAWRLKKTLQMLRKYPPIWQNLAEAGLVDQEVQPIRASAPAETPAATAEIEENSQPSPKNSAQEAQMEEERLSQSAMERLAFWDKTLVTAKEIVTGCLGFLIIATTLLVITIATFAVIFGPAKSESWTMIKDALLILNGLAGVVLGYYFGRVPGELRANKAETDAKAAQSQLDQTVAEVRGILESQGTGLSRAAGGGLQLSPTQVDRLRTIVTRPR